MQCRLVIAPGLSFRQLRVGIPRALGVPLGENMKWIAIVLNVILIVTVTYLLLTKGAPGKDERFLVAVLFAAPISSLVALVLKGGESWIGLYFKRKVLEEKQRIEQLGGEQ